MNTQTDNLPKTADENGEIQYPTTRKIKQETEDFIIMELEDGSFQKQKKYKKYYSHVPTSESDMLSLYKLFNTEDNPDVLRMSTQVGKELKIKEVYTNPYESFDEKTGESKPGVTTTIKTEDDEYIATSSKTVYNTLEGLFKVFGYPNTENYKAVTLKVTERKRDNGMQINLELKGF